VRECADMTWHVYIQSDPEGAAREALFAALDEGIEVTCGEAPAGETPFRMIVWGQPTREILKASPRCETLLIPYAGLPKKTAELMPEFPHIAVHNLHHNAQATAEHAVGLLLAAAKSIPRAERRFRDGDWSPRFEKGMSLQLGGRRGSHGSHAHESRSVPILCAP
jgi:phosphoglycerate dehydrogenase-like enzyme